MSGKICAVFGCNNYEMQKDSRSFFRFPRDKKMCDLWCCRCDLWVLKCQRSDLDKVYKKGGTLLLNKTYKVCSDHFQVSDFRNPRLYSQGLKPGSVPTQNLPKNKASNATAPSKRGSPSKRLHKHIPVGSPDMLPDARLPKQNSSQKIKHLKEKLRRAQKIICKRNALVTKLRAQITHLQNSKVKSKSDLVEYFGNSSTMSQMFFKSQLTNTGRKNKGRRYTENDKTVALAIYYCSPSAYKMLRRLCCLPTIRSIRRWLQNLGVSPGINRNVLSLMKVKAENLSVSERVVSVVFDEMALQDNITYDARADEFDGFVNLGEHGCHKNNRLEHANQAMVVLIRGLKLNFKQIIGYFLSKDSTPGDCLKDIVLDVLRKVKETGFIPKVVVCDQGSNNLKMRSLFGLSEEKPFFEYHGNKVYFFHDAPHLLKSVRNNLKNYDFECADGKCSWSHIVEFYNKDKSMKPRLAPKLNKKCIELPPFSPMRVCLAAHVLSHSVSCGIMTNVTFNSMSEDALPTANFIEKMDILFDIFNSSQKYSAKEFRCALNDERKHLTYLNEMAEYLKTITVANNQTKNPHCIKGWVENIAALKLLWIELRNEYDFSYLLTRRLTQDCIENVFSVIRGKGGNNVTPDSCRFRSALKLAMTNELLHPSEDSNCSLDASTLLLMKSDLENTQSPLYLPPLTVRCALLENCEDIPNSLIQENACAYVCGWLCSKLPHLECRSALSSKEEDMGDLRNVHILLKQYDDANFLYPNVTANIAYKEISNVFEAKFMEFLSISMLHVKRKIAQLINVKSMSYLCKECAELFIDKCLNVMIQCYLNEEKEKSNQKRSGRNAKAKKVMHE